jgi:hypothetical protein
MIYMSSTLIHYKQKCVVVDDLITSTQGWVKTRLQESCRI